MSQTETEAQTLFVKNEAPRRIMVNSSEYRDEQPTAEEKDITHFVASTVRAEDGLQKGVTPVDEHTLRAIREDERVERKFVEGPLRTVSRNKAIA